MRRKIAAVLRSTVRLYVQGWSTMDPAVALGVFGGPAVAGTPRN